MSLDPIRRVGQTDTNRQNLERTRNNGNSPDSVFGFGYSDTDLESMSYEEFENYQAAEMERYQALHSNNNNNLKNVSELGEGEYTLDNITRAEESLSNSVLDNSAKTLGKYSQMAVLKETGIDVDKLKEHKADDGTYSFSMDNQHYRVVEHNGKTKIIATTIDGDKAKTKVYEVNNVNNKTDAATISDSGKVRLSNDEINALAKRVANGERIFYQRNADGSLGPNPEFKDLDDATLYAIIEKSKDLENRSSVDRNEYSRRYENDDVNIKVYIENEKLNEIEDEIYAHKKREPDRADRRAHTIWEQQKRELEIEKRKIQNKINEYKTKLRRLERESRSYESGNYDYRRMERQKSDIEKFTDKANELARAGNAVNSVVSAFTNIANGFRRLGRALRGG